VNAGSADVPSALSAQREHCGINSQRCADITKALMMAMGEPVLRRHATRRPRSSNQNR